MNELTAEHPVWRALSSEELRLRLAVESEREEARQLHKMLIACKLPPVSPYIHYADLCEGLLFLARNLKIDVRAALQECASVNLQKAWAYCHKAKRQFIASLTETDDSRAFELCAEVNFQLALKYCGQNLLDMGDYSPFPKPPPEDIEELRRVLSMHDKDLGNFRECQRTSYYEPKPEKPTSGYQPVTEQPLAALRTSRKRDVFLSAKLETALARAIDPVRYMRDLGYVHVLTRNEDGHEIFYFAGIGKSFALIRDEKKAYALCVL